MAHVMQSMTRAKPPLGEECSSSHVHTYVSKCAGIQVDAFLLFAPPGN